MPDRQTTGTGLVVAAHGRRGTLETESADRLQYLVRGRRLKVVCGDHVKWELDDTGKLAIVSGIKPRINMLERQPPGRTGTELLAANLSLLIVVCAPQPVTDWFIVDRYLCSGEIMGCRSLLISNKSDLCEHDPDHDAKLREYVRIGYECLSVSAQKNQGIEALRKALHEQIGIFVGQSGVGKSSLINRLVPDANIVVGSVSTATREGKHTTTASVMHDLPEGGRLIDTPGVRDFMPAVPEPQSVQAGFPEILAAAGRCRFTDCHHLREPDCAVKQALQSGAISKRRYESYRRLLRAVNGQQGS